MTQMTIPENSPAFAGTSQQHLLRILQNRRMPMGKRLSLSRKSIFRTSVYHENRFSEGDYFWVGLS